MAWGISAEEKACEEEFLSQTAEEKREVRANLRRLQQRIQQTKENLNNGATDEEPEKLKGVVATWEVSPPVKLLDHFSWVKPFSGQACLVNTLDSKCSHILYR